VPDWLLILRPSGGSFHRSRMLLGALAFGLPMGYQVFHQQHLAAGMMGFAILATIMMDMGGSRRQRLGSMLFGNILIITAASISLSINANLLLWFAGIILLVTLIGASLSAGFALDLLLRMVASAYLVGYPGSVISGSILPYYLSGAVMTIVLALCVAPRINNPISLKVPPHWHNDYQQLRQGQFAGATFGLLLAIACALSFFFAQKLHFTAPNVAAICTLMVFRPEPKRTSSTIWQRLMGVLLASLIAWAFVFEIQSYWALVALAAITGALVPIAFANGLMYVAAVTTFLIYLILALLGIQGHAAEISAENRIFETLLGAAIAIIFAMIFRSLKPETGP
jgi:hypothetical protein